MPKSNPIVEAAASFRAQLISGQAQAAAQMLDLYASLIERFDPEMRATLAAMSADEITPVRLFQANRLQSILGRLALDLGDYANTAGILISERQKTVIEAAPQHAKRLVAASATFGDSSGGTARNFGATSGSTWTEVDRKTLENLVGVTAEGAPFGDELGRIAGDSVERVRGVLLRGAATGQSPEAMARAVKDDLGGRAGRFLTIARTAEMHAYTSSLFESFDENSDVVRGWRWHASLSFDTCLACLALHGRVFPLGEPFERHFNCRCMALPVLENDDPSEWQTGEEWLREQDEDNQKRALGAARFAAWESGEVELKDFLGYDETERWGGMYYERSLVMVRSAAAQPESQPTQPQPTPEPEPTPATPAPTPAERLTVSSRIDVKVRGVRRKQVQEALDAIDALHEVSPPELPFDAFEDPFAPGDAPLPLKTAGVKRMKNALGAYVRTVGSDDFSTPYQMLLHSSRGLDTTQMVVAHETGHYIDHWFLGEAGRYASDDPTFMKPLLEAMAKSERVKELKAAAKLPTATPSQKSYIKYLLANREMFARAYSQWVAVRSGNATMLAQLKQIQPGTGPSLASQWLDEDFEPIAVEIDRLFTALGWLK